MGEKKKGACLSQGHETRGAARFTTAEFGAELSSAGEKPPKGTQVLDGLLRDSPIRETTWESERERGGGRKSTSLAPWRPAQWGPSGLAPKAGRCGRPRGPSRGRRAAQAPRADPGSWAGGSPASPAAALRAHQVAPPAALPASPALFGGGEGPRAAALPSPTPGPPPGPPAPALTAFVFFRLRAAARSGGRQPSAPCRGHCWPGAAPAAAAPAPVVPAGLHALRCGAGPRGGGARGRGAGGSPRGALAARGPGARGACTGRPAARTAGCSLGGAGWTGVGIPVWGPWGSFKGSWVNLKGPRAISSCQLAGGWGERREATSPAEAQQPAPGPDARGTDLPPARARTAATGAPVPAPEGSPRWRGVPASPATRFQPGWARGHRPLGVSQRRERPLGRPGSLPGAASRRASGLRARCGPRSGRYWQGPQMAAAPPRGWSRGGGRAPSRGSRPGALRARASHGRGGQARLPGASQGWGRRPQ